MRLIRDLVTAQVPATSANLGPGFDSFGIALALHDVVEVSATTGATHVDVEGAGAGEVPDGEDHLVVRAIRLALDQAGAPQAGLALRCRNSIPHGRGLGSSAAAVIAGLIAARALISEPEELPDSMILQLATEMEGHPDNAAPALHGGATIAWIDEGQAQATPISIHPELSLTLLVPTERLSTTQARTALPRTVSHADAAFNAARAALLVRALEHQPELLFAATADRLHQQYRADVMPQTLELLASLREAGLPAVVSGAGPSILVLAPLPAHVLTQIPPGWRTRHPGVDNDGASSD